MEGNRLESWKYTSGRTFRMHSESEKQAATQPAFRQTRREGRLKSLLGRQAISYCDLQNTHKKNILRNRSPLFFFNAKRGGTINVILDVSDGTLHHHHHQNTKWGDIFWKNGVHPSSRVQRLNAKEHWSFSGSTWWPNSLLRHFMLVCMLQLK